MGKCSRGKAVEHTAGLEEGATVQYALEDVQALVRLLLFFSAQVERRIGLFFSILGHTASLKQRLGGIEPLVRGILPLRALACTRRLSHYVETGRIKRKSEA